jgi:hypothetical protein
MSTYSVPQLSVKCIFLKNHLFSDFAIFTQ